MRRPVAILFDVGDTLLVERRFDLEAGVRVVAPHPASQAPDLARTFQHLLGVLHSAGREPLLARWLIETVPALAGCATETVEDAIWPAVVTLDATPGVGELLARLRGAGVTLGAVSNACFSGRILRRELARHGLGEYLAFVLSSGDMGIRKPARAVFETALARAGAAADATWFVGDTYAEDVVGAARAGLTAVWLSDPGSVPGSDVAYCRVANWPEFGVLYAACLPAAAGT